MFRFQSHKENTDLSENQAPHHLLSSASENGENDRAPWYSHGLLITFLMNVERDLFSSHIPDTALRYLCFVACWTTIGSPFLGLWATKSVFVDAESVNIYSFFSRRLRGTLWNREGLENLMVFPLAGWWFGTFFPYIENDYPN